MRIYPDSFAFPLLLGLMASLPTFGIDAPLPSLSATGDDLGTTSAELGLASVYLMSLGAPPLAYGTISDRVGRKPYEYGVIFGASSLSAVAGARGSRKLSGWGLSPAQVIKVELALSTILATSLLLTGGKSALVVVLVMVGVALSLGLISPYATKEALGQIPEIMGSISAQELSCK